MPRRSNKPLSPVRQVESILDRFSGKALTVPKKTNLHVRELAREAVVEAVDALRAALMVPGERVQAANILISHGFGRPSQTVNHRVIRKLDDLSDEELEALSSDGPAAVVDGIAEEYEE